MVQCPTKQLAGIKTLLQSPERPMEPQVQMPRSLQPARTRSSSEDLQVGLTSAQINIDLLDPIGIASSLVTKPRASDHLSLAVSFRFTSLRAILALSGPCMQTAQSLAADWRLGTSVGRVWQHKPNARLHLGSPSSQLARQD